MRVMLPPHLAEQAAADLGATPVDAGAYEAHRIALGVPRGGEDFAYGDTFAHEADMDQLGGVDFEKGCYVGQEVVSRVEHRASARSRLVPVAFEDAAPAAGLPVMAGDKQVGTLGSAAKGRGLAMLRLDRVADAIAAGTQLTCGGIALRAGEAGLGALCLAGRNASGDMSARSIHTDGLVRCPWPKQDPLYVAYHDEEWGVPEYDDRALYEKLVLDGFQAGLSWITILRKRENFRRAFDDFAPEKIARYTPKKIERLMQDAGIVRNRAKIEGAVSSARAYLKIMEEGPGFSKLLWDFVDGSPKTERVQARRPGAGGDRNFAQDVEGTGRPRFQIRRTDHRLRLHAGGRHGQRSPGDLPPPCGGPEARQGKALIFSLWPGLSRPSTP